MSEGDTLIIKKNLPRLVLKRKWQTKPTQDFYRPTSYTRAKTTLLFWPPRSGNWKGSQTSSRKG